MILSPATLVEPVRCARRAGSLRVEVQEGTAGLSESLACWDSLVERALVANPFHEPWFLLPAARHLAGETALLFALVQDDIGQWLGFFPLRARPRFKGMPLRVLEAWKHPHCFLCTPLLDATRAHETLTAFLHWARVERCGAGVIDLPLVNGDGQFAEIATDVAARLGLRPIVNEHHERALLEPESDAETYLAAALSAGNRKELRRQRRRLTELGKLETRIFQPGDDVDFWVRGFLELEASGWKGQRATALASDPEQRAFFTDMVRAGAERGRVALLGLFLDGRPIALKCNLLAPPGAFAFKIAYDEHFARYSPGIQLELENIRWLHERSELTFMDSCAVPGHFMIERLWRERRSMQSLWLSTGRWTGNLLLTGLPLVRAVRRLLRDEES